MNTNQHEISRGVADAADGIPHEISVDRSFAAGPHLAEPLQLFNGCDVCFYIELPHYQHLGHCSEVDF